MKYIFLAAGIGVALMIGLALSSAEAKKEDGWKKFTAEETLNSFQAWVKKMPWDDGVSLDNKLRAAQIWVDIEQLKREQKCKPIQLSKDTIAPPKPNMKHDWTGIGGASNTKDNSRK